MSEEDNSLFLFAVKNVTPLKKENRVSQYDPKTVKQQAKQAIKKIKQKQHVPVTTIEITPHISENRVPLITSEEKMFYHQKSIRLQALSKLKKGEFINQAQLDLHGYTREESQLALSSFIENARQNKLRYVRVVHGKGYNSKEHFPVIKNLVNQYLRELNSVLAFCSAPERDGGAGAVNIFLRRT